MTPGALRCLGRRRGDVSPEPTEGHHPRPLKASENSGPGSEEADGTLVRLVHFQLRNALRDVFQRYCLCARVLHAQIAINTHICLL